MLGAFTVLESVIRKLSIQITLTSDFFSFHHFQERQILQRVSACENIMHISDQRNHLIVSVTAMP